MQKGTEYNQMAPSTANVDNLRLASPSRESEKTSRNNTQYKMKELWHCSKHITHYTVTRKTCSNDCEYDARDNDASYLCLREAEAKQWPPKYSTHMIGPIWPVAARAHNQHETVRKERHYFANIPRVAVAVHASACLFWRAVNKIAIDKIQLFIC